MDMVPRSSYIQEDLIRKMVEWTHVSSQFCLKFSFTTEYLAQREDLLRIKYFIFHWHPKETTPKVVYSYHKSVVKLKEAIHCWKIHVDNVDDDDPCDIHIK
jgi:hypothetical protein